MLAVILPCMSIQEIVFVLILLLPFAVLLYLVFSRKKKPLTGHIVARTTVTGKKNNLIFILVVHDEKDRNWNVATTESKWENASFGDRFTMEKNDKLYRPKNIHRR